MTVYDYATLTEVKAAVPDGGLAGSTDYDDLITACLTRASRMIDRSVGRWDSFFYSPSSDTDTVRYFDGTNERRLRVDEMITAPTTVKMSEDGSVTSSDYTALAAADWYAYPYNSTPVFYLVMDAINGDWSVWYSFPKAIEVTGKFGWSSTVPDDIKTATIEQAVRLFKKGQQAFQDAGAGSETGQMIYASSVDKDLKEKYLMSYILALQI